MTADLVMDICKEIETLFAKCPVSFIQKAKSATKLILIFKSGMNAISIKIHQFLKKITSNYLLRMIIIFLNK